MKQLKAKIIENKKISEKFYKMRIESAYLAKNSKPGQFVEVKCSDSIEPLLRRPLGVHRILNNGIEIFYEVVGKGTGLLSRKVKGESVDIIGPLGNGFSLPRHPKGAAKRNPKPYTLNPILIAGGIGVAPLVALAESLRKKRQKVAVIIGAKTKSHVNCVKELKALGCDVDIATEDGSLGQKGLATSLLHNTQYTIHTTIYACGPNAMLKAVAKIAESRRIPCQVSLEERMACGVGVCLGCPVKVRTQYDYKMVCKDGPVFDAKEIAW
ncbi:MAG: dihydroorotate dehydrogenase electron transfer subunit [Candidatus Omnitrophica bacterium]|nr:dihydroorotate dehydrogenase electron transfer subunit [Candidatus Omnitrophota bacterium]